MNQFQQSPPVARVVVDLVHPVGYGSDSTGPRLLVRMHPMAEARQEFETPFRTRVHQGSSARLRAGRFGEFGRGG